MNLQTSINILQNRQWNLVDSCPSCNIYHSGNQHLITPLKSVGRIPSGTIDSMFRSVYTARETGCPTTSKDAEPLPVLTIILEKQASQFWGRIERKNLLAITTGNTPEIVAKKLSLQLREFTNYLGSHSREELMLSGDLTFNYLYDMTRVRELFQQFRISSLAEQANISPDILSQFMTSKQHPSYQQAQQIEELIQQFGREMINFSML